MTEANKVPVLTIDGPRGSGKGTVGQLLAQRLDWHFLDSGALYRALGVAANRAEVDLGDKAALARLAMAMDIRFLPRSGGDVEIGRASGRERGEISVGAG